MVLRRIYKLINNSAFTLAETVTAVLIVSVSALLLLSSIIAAANYYTMAADLNTYTDEMISALYSGECESISVAPTIKNEGSFEIFTEDEIIFFAEKIADSSITLYYYGGEEI